MPTIYLGMALSETPEWWHKDFHKHVSEKLVDIPRVVVSRFVGLDKTTTAPDVYDYDIGLAGNADLMIALTRFPSLGLGMEIQARSMLKKPTVLFHPAGMYLSKMPRGAPQVRWQTYQKGHEDGELQALDIARQIKDLLIAQ